MGQRGKIGALAGICEFNLSYVSLGWKALWSPNVVSHCQSKFVF